MFVKKISSINLWFGFFDSYLKVALKATCYEQVFVSVVCVMNNSRDERCTIYIFKLTSILKLFFRFCIQYAGSGVISGHILSHDLSK